MDPTITEFKQSVEKGIVYLKEDLKSIRTGRANPGLIENIIVEAYGGQSKLRLQELASITTEGPSYLAVSPFDPSTTSDIEKAILKSPIGLSPAVQGNRIMITIPPLSEEQRQKYTKIISQKSEEKKSSIRNMRDDARRKIKTSFENKEMSEDEKFRIEKEIDNITQGYVEQVQKIKEAKEKEIMEL